MKKFVRQNLQAIIYINFLQESGGSCSSDSLIRFTNAQNFSYLLNNGKEFVLNGEISKM